MDLKVWPTHVRPWYVIRRGNTAPVRLQEVLLILIDQQRRVLHHATRAAAGAESTALAAEGNQLLGAAVIATDAQESVLESAALEEVLEVPFLVARQRAPRLGQGSDERRVMLFDQLIQETQSAGEPQEIRSPRCVDRVPARTCQIYDHVCAQSIPRLREIRAAERVFASHDGAEYAGVISYERIGLPNFG